MRIIPGHNNGHSNPVYHVHNHVVAHCTWEGSICGEMQWMGWPTLFLKLFVGQGLVVHTPEIVGPHSFFKIHLHYLLKEYEEIQVYTYFFICQLLVKEKDNTVLYSIF